MLIVMKKGLFIKQLIYIHTEKGPPKYILRLIIGNNINSQLNITNIDHSCNVDLHSRFSWG